MSRTFTTIAITLLTALLVAFAPNGASAQQNASSPTEGFSSNYSPSRSLGSESLSPNYPRRFRCLADRSCFKSCDCRRSGRGVCKYPVLRGQDISYRSCPITRR